MMIKHVKPQRLVFSNNHQYNDLSTVLFNFKTEQSGNDHISSLCKQKLFMEAIQAFDYLQSRTRFRIYPSTYAHLISGCSTLKSLDYGRTVHDHLLNFGSQPDIILQNHILNMYGKCGSLRDARKMFYEMPERNKVSWTSMIAGYSQNHEEEDALKTYLEMRRSGFMPDQFTFGSILRACSGLSDVELGRQLHAHVLKSEFGCHLIAQNALVAMYTKLDQIYDALVVFDKIAEKDLISWGSMISGLAQNGFEFDSLCFFKDMLSMGVYRLNEYIFGSIFNACGSLLQLEYGRQIHGMAIKFGLGRDAFANCSLSDMYAKCGGFDYARTAFYQIERHDLVSWNAIIAGFSFGGDAGDAMSFFSRMRHSGFIPDEITVRCLLCCCTSYAMLYQGQQLHAYIIKMGFNLDVPVCNTLLTMYTKCSNLPDAFNIFEDMYTTADLVSWNSVLTACMQHNQADEVFRLLKLMFFSRNKPDEITLTNVLGACAVLASLEMGNQVHDYALKAGLKAHNLIANGLIDMYAKCGALDSARKLFEFMRNPDVISWSSLIVGYAQFGYGEEALKLFRTMSHLGIKPNHITFVGVFSACSRVGLVAEGCQYFRSMKIDHGIVPTREHCACVVDLLSRAGHLGEAENFINQMPFDPDIVVWKTLLAGCRTHGNLEIGTRAAENILKLDSSNSAAHMLLCNIYASTGSWADVARVRKMMKIRGVRKTPGQSWIEIKDSAHVFLAEDRSHPKMEEIYIVLEELWLQMLEAGYLPDQRFVSGEPLIE
ncbi:pentatricopeptide repeat-containing protein At3g53360, mitochondrial [Macadamia integrifolia]|uniref:pentatricopeptide repeat-containing protein At3g53360, mitochondrial n=1 Tax=Macadamia integrifolia TaxID=60698 RepID=UPI001C4E921D|nr:pentatricopeptide repeat-containing protein At3g53360, mitochondrial [Macadamia integrifolia]